MNDIYDFILKHWPFFAVAVMLGFIGEGMKRAFTKEAARTSKVVWWFRATMPAHPVVAGMVIGASGQLPVTVDALGEGGGILYYGFAGMVSSYVYAAFQNFIEKRKLEGAPESLRKGIDAEEIIEDVIEAATEAAEDDDSSEEPREPESKPGPEDSGVGGVEEPEVEVKKP